jgi:hypothetical protein
VLQLPHPPEEVEPLKVEDPSLPRLPDENAKAENFFSTSALPQQGHSTFFALPGLTSSSKSFSHLEQQNSYMGMIDSSCHS